MDVKNVVDKFTASINFDNTEYKIEELVKLLKDAYKDKSSSKKNKADNNGELKEKKPLSAYNIFIQKKMEEFKTQDLAPKDKLKKAVEAWNLHKESLKSADSSSTP